MQLARLRSLPTSRITQGKGERGSGRETIAQTIEEGGDMVVDYVCVCFNEGFLWVTLRSEWVRTDGGHTE